MKVTVESREAARLFVVEGQVDMNTSSTLRGHLRDALEAKAKPIVVDLSSVEFIDSSGLATLIEALQGVSRFGGSLRLCGLTPKVRQLFELSNLTSIFDLRGDAEEALGN